MKTKKCGKCGAIKGLGEFYKTRSACKKCSIAYTQKRIAENQVQLLQYLEHHSCVDCGDSRAIVLTFDHLRDKHANIGDMVSSGSPWSTVLREIEKCQVTCHNCHTIRTQQRQNSYKWQHHIATVA